MSAPRSDNFARTDFKKTGFAAAGPEHERQRGGGTERSCVGPSQRVANLEGASAGPEVLICRGRGSHTSGSPSHPIACQFTPCCQRDRRSILPGPFGTRRDVLANCPFSLWGRLAKASIDIHKPPPQRQIASGRSPVPFRYNTQTRRHHAQTTRNARLDGLPRS